MKLLSETDEYIARANEFAVPILKHLRRLIHEECPDITEVIKWGFPCFEYKGILCAITAHKTHCSFSFWKAAIMSDPDGVIEIVGKTGMGHFGRIQSLEDLSTDVILRKYLREAILLNEKGVKIPKKKVVKTEFVIPDYLISAIGNNQKALSTFERFSPSNKKEYVEWVTDAKTAKTRDKRLAQTIEWLAEGKVRNWKYIR